MGPIGSEQEIMLTASLESAALADEDEIRSLLFGEIGDSLADPRPAGTRWCADDDMGKSPALRRNIIFLKGHRRSLGGREVEALIGGRLGSASGQ